MRMNRASMKKGRPKAPKRTRVAKAGDAKDSSSRKSKRPQANGDASYTNKIPQDFKINTDNPLFNAIVNPSAALQSTAVDFLDSLKETPEAGQPELVNCILHACGCNEAVNEDEAVDYDGVVDALYNFTEALKQRQRRQTMLLRSPDTALHTLHQHDMDQAKHG
ncbi:hypothetical protein V8E52_009183 [Russula decolorans]